MADTPNTLETTDKPVPEVSVTPASAKPASEKPAAKSSPAQTKPAAKQAGGDQPGWRVFGWFRRSKTVTPTLCGKCPLKTQKKKRWYKRPFRILLIAFLSLQVLGGVVAFNQIKPQEPPVSIQRVAEDVKSEHSRYLDQLQARFGNPKDGLRIAYIDRDKVALMAGLNATRNPVADRVAAHTIDIEEQTGARLSRILALQADQLAAEDLISALPLFNDELLTKGSSIPTKRLAIITPAPQITSGLEMAAMLTHFPSYAIETLGRTPGKIDIAPMEMQRFVDYHETTHALDDEYVWATNRTDIMLAAIGLGSKSQLEHDYLTHKAEMLADVHASLLNAQDGYLDTASKIASVRAIGTLLTGPIAAKADNYGATIYFTAPGLYEVQSVIDRLGQDRLKKMSLDQTMELAYRIVEQKALTLDQFTKLQQWNKHGVSNAVTYILDIKSGKAALPHDPDVRSAVQTALREFDRTFSMDRILQPPRANAPTNDFQRELAWRNLVAQAQAQGGTPLAFADVVTRFKDRTRTAIAEGRSVSAMDKALLEHVDEYLQEHAWTGQANTTRSDAPSFETIGQMLKGKSPAANGAGKGPGM